ncbi:MAG: 2-phospho-L-lactate transferase [Microthrixaceae bacterium]|nr:2-phospho-L-lactate transferase [Microthrixaceae bacterium]
MGVGPSVTVVAGGVGAARLLRGVVRVTDPDLVTAVVNVGDDDILHGLHISPDLDTITYTLAEAIDPTRGWGLRNETWQAMELLRRYAASAGREDLSWFNLGDTDLGTHLYRTSRRLDGGALSEITAEIAAAWGIRAHLLPVSNDPIRTRLVTADGVELTFQEYFVRHHHGVEVCEVSFVGAAVAEPAPGVIDAIGAADVVIIAPSNPIVSIEPVLAVPGVRAAVESRRDSCVAVSPIVGGRALKGPADRLLAELGHEASALGVAGIYRDLAASIVIDSVDTALGPAIEATGMRAVCEPSIMVDIEAATALAAACVGAVR